MLQSFHQESYSKRYQFSETLLLLSNGVLNTSPYSILVTINSNSCRSILPITRRY
ncbi:unknown [Salmonella phage FelixO1]|uniref:Uncharacterized protein n=1 Tax=Salmonella phage Felix O1 (isolate Felix O1-VT1) TaxID=1283336 RepID=Q6KGG2_BPFO1|nr:unknown [Salmonella phage FelixO1]